MHAWQDFLTRFKDMEYSRNLELLTQKILKSVGAPRSGRLLNNEEEENSALPDSLLKFNLNFNQALLSQHFQDLSDDPRTLPFIEFSAIGLLVISDDNASAEDLLPIVQAFMTHQNSASIYLDLPLLIEVNNDYYVYGNTKDSHWSITKLSSQLPSLGALPFRSAPSVLPYDRKHYPIYHEILEKKAHIHFSTQAQQITKIKQLVNSTFYIQKLLNQAENIQLNFTGLFTSLGPAVIDYYFGSSIYNSIYQALSLITSAEINVTQRFKDEVGEFIQFLELFKQLSSTPPTPNQPDSRTYHPSTCFQVGHALGFTIRHIYDANEHRDIAVLSQFSADLPNHIDRMTTVLNSHNGSVIQHAPNINPAQLKALKKEATQLLSTLKNAQYHAKHNKQSPFYQMYQIINYAFMLRQIIVLLRTTIAQIGQLNQAYQISIRDLLSTFQDSMTLLLKYCHHAEVELILTPLTLSDPLMKMVRSAYNKLASQVKNLANFSLLGEELLNLDNAIFINKLESDIRAMFQDCLESQHKIRWAQEALIRFIGHIETDHPDPKILLKNYASLSPYLEKINPSLDRTIIRELTKSMAPPKDIMQALRRQLSAYLTKLHRSEELRSQQCQAVLIAIPNLVDLSLLPYSLRTGCDIELKRIEAKSLDSIAFTQKQPALIEHCFQSKTSYVFFGNTDGRKWAFTPIAEAFIDPDVLEQFQKLPPEGLTLSYQLKYKSLYQQMILKKAHTHYRSQFESMESEILESQSFTLTSLAFKPIEMVQKKWRGTPLGIEHNAAPINRENPDVSKIIRSNQTQDYFADLEVLSTEKILLLYGWYQQKIDNYHLAKMKLVELKECINQLFREQRIYFATKSPEQQNCQYLYYYLRPYLIELESFADFDYKMVQALSASSKPILPDEQITGKTFHNLFEKFSLDWARKRVEIWQHRANDLLAQAKDNLALQHEKDLRKKGGDFAASEREGYLLESTAVSTKINEFHNALKEWLPVLNHTIQAQLAIPAPQKKDSIPYPDILDLKNQLRHPPIVLFFKRMFNAVYHLEQLALAIEEIRRDDSEHIKKDTIHRLILGKIVPHSKQLCSLASQIYNDKVLSKQYQELFQNYKEIMGKITHFFQPYTLDVKKVSPQTQPVGLPGLWVVMNAFYTFPAHLLTLSGQNCADNRVQFTESNHLNISAKRATQNIEQIIRDSNHYFKLFFFDGPMIYQLNQKLQAQLAVFSRTTQEVTLSHLEILLKDYFAPLMLNAETKEHEWFLCEGALTKPLEGIINEWYKGLIFPLKKTFDEKAYFSTHEFILTSRISSESQRLEQLSRPNETLKTELTEFSHFITKMEDYLSKKKSWANLTTSLFARTTHDLTPLISDYANLIYPRLTQLSHRFIPSWLAVIAPHLNRENLKDITLQIREYAKYFENFAWLHNKKHQQFREKILIFLSQLEEQSKTNDSDIIPEDICVQYLDYVEKLKEHQTSFIPDWLKHIHSELCESSITAMIEPTKTYKAYLEGLEENQTQCKRLSSEKLAYLHNEIATQRSSSKKQYREFFSTNYFQSRVNSLRCRASGLMDSNLHKEYNRELTLSFTEQKTQILRKALEEDDLNQSQSDERKGIDCILNQIFKAQSFKFKQQHFEYFQRCDHLQTAINQFKKHLDQDKLLPPSWRDTKINCLHELEKIIHAKRDEPVLVEFLDKREQQLRTFIQVNKDSLLKRPTQFHNTLDWLIHCMMSLFEALGLYTPECDQRYTALITAFHKPETSHNWQNFSLFSASSSPPPIGSVIIAGPLSPAR